MKISTALILVTGLLFTACESEEITPEEYITIHIDGVPVDGGGGVTETGDGSFSAVIDGVDFEYDDLEITNELDATLTILARDLSGENAIQIILPLMTMTEGDHELTYPATAGYNFIYLGDGEGYYATDDPENTITIIEYDDVAKHVQGEFSLSMYVEGGGPTVDELTGEFDVNY